MLQFGPKHVGIEDVHIFKHCHEMTGLLLWIGTYCISCVVQQTSRVKYLSSLVRYDDSCFATIRHVQSIKRLVRPRPNIRCHRVLFIHYFSWPCELFKNAHACALRDCLGVSRPFVSDTSPKCIDQEGLERRRTGTRQAQTDDWTTMIEATRMDDDDHWYDVGGKLNNECSTLLFSPFNSFVS